MTEIDGKKHSLNSLEGGKDRHFLGNENFVVFSVSFYENECGSLGMQG